MEVAGACRYMPVRREEEYNELQETIEHMNEMPGGLMFTMKRNHKLLEDVPELGAKLCQEIRLQTKTSLQTKWSCREIRRS